MAVALSPRILRHLLILVLALASAQVAAYGGDPPISPSARLQFAVAIPVRDEGGLRQFGIIARTAQKDLSDAQLTALAKQLVRGVEPEALTDALYSRAKITSPALNDREFGTAAARVQITIRLTEMAQRSAPADPETARMLLRAALLIAVHDRMGSHRVLAQFPRDDGLRQILAGNEEMIRAVTAIADEIQISAKAYVDHIMISGPLLDEMIAGAAIDKDKAERFLRSASALWDTPETYLSDRWRTCGLLWRFRCLAAARQDTEALKLVESTVDSLRSRSRSTLVTTWLDQVMNEPGASPRSSGIKIITDPNQLKPKP